MRSLLFVPADGGSKLDKAMASGADGVIIDLEDSIAPERKAAARAAAFLAGTFRGSSKRLIGMTWGPEDLAAEIGAEANREADGSLTEPYRLARAICLLGATAAKLPAIETIHVDFRNLDNLRKDTELARRDGFTGRLAIHPAQVPVFNEVFTPSQAQIEKAKAIVAAFAAKPGAGAVGIDGRMYDRPHLARAQALLARTGN
jgi:citrate lyase subunit beta/citryl-CoA lyase